VYWISVGALSPFALLVGCFNARRWRCETIVGPLSSTVRRASSINTRIASTADFAFNAPAFSGNLGDNRVDYSCVRTTGQGSK
jgi:hypothetical protein